MHTVLNSFDVMGGSHTFTAIWTSEKFRDGNPMLYKALLAALKEATDFVKHNPKQAAEYWIEDSKSKLPPDMAAKIVGGKQVHWTMVPENTMKFADFMASVGRIKVKADVVEGLLLSGHLRPEGKLRSRHELPQAAVGMLPNDRLAYSPIANARAAQAAEGRAHGGVDHHQCRGMGPDPDHAAHGVDAAGRRLADARHSELVLARIRQPRRLLAAAAGL